jgi:PTS system nitrogen regulatory IIA component
MRIVDFLRPELIVPELQASDKLGILRELATHIGRSSPGIPAEEILRVLAEREQLASTALSDGIAIPHGKLDRMPHMVGCLGRARHAVDFGSLDGNPTQLFFVLMAPGNAASAHLKALARISRLFKERGVRERLIHADGADAMYRVISAEDPAL